MDKQLAKTLTLSVSLLQGITLWFLYYSFEQQIFPATDPIWFNPLVAVSIVLPVLFLLSSTPQNWQRLLSFLGIFAIILTAMASYTGIQQTPVEIIESGGILFAFVVTTGIASFKAIMYGQLWSEHDSLNYQKLFQLSWRNFLIAAESTLFTLILFAILNLGAALFEVIGIDLFSNLLQQSWFNIPVICMAFGFAIITFRRISKTVDIIASILQTLIKFLLPMLAFVGVAFLFTLPFTGLEKLWATGHGSALLLALQAMTLFFVNAVYQNQHQQLPYPMFWHRFIYLSIAILPIYSVIIAYGLWLRIDQYGWSVSRCWGVMIWAILTCFCLGYLQGIVRQKDKWLNTLSRVNVRMGLVMLLLMIVVNTPLLNFQQISANSQIQRLDDNVIEAEELDINYFRWNLGRSGYLALQQLKKSLQVSHPALVTKIDRIYAPKRDADEEVSLAQFQQFVDYWPDARQFPDDLLNALYNQENNRWFRLGHQHYTLIAFDLNQDSTPEYLSVEQSSNFTNINIWRTNEAEAWHSQGLYYNGNDSDDLADIRKLLDTGKIKTVDPMWQDIMIGEVRLRVPL
ncbi:DUF4153 domain-containing protein [Thalassotalea mangrovi]|uniref:DUF4153 domain-containing protein n=1 Tax=Thalassotalea mangrovi TaxID=2572245 RepID=A0A4U1B9G1_9GAMM|nr:DUF4153 domain-containing protein [Thalassotalea mangrovi]TKB47102.1 DUF4153 domain-containing protein [Thalassotalea mangrovi]